MNEAEQTLYDSAEALCRETLNARHELDGQAASAARIALDVADRLAGVAPTNLLADLVDFRLDLLHPRH